MNANGQLTTPRTGPARLLYTLGPQLAYVTVLVAALVAWHAIVTGESPATQVIVFSGMCLLFIISGHIALSLAGLVDLSPSGITFCFVYGYVIISIALFALVLLLALDIGLSVAALSLIVILLLLFFTAQKRAHTALIPSASAAELIALVICVVGATMWSVDALHPLIIDGDTAIFRTWQDRFVHTRLISLFAQSSGNSLSNPQMA